MIALLRITLALTVLIFTFSSSTRAELSIDSVYPNVGKVGEDLSVTIRGNGFDENTRVSISLDTGNRKQVLGAVEIPNEANGVAVLGHTAYVANGSGLQIVDVSDPSDSTIIGSVDIPDHAQGVAVLDQTAYIADGRDGGLQIIDVSDPRNPAVIGMVNTPGYAWDVAVLDQTAYVADGRDGGLQIIDASDPRNPAIVGTVDTPGEARDIAVLGQTAYVADGDLQIVDVSDPRNPGIVGTVDTYGSTGSVSVLDLTAYVLSKDGGLQVVDVSDPLRPSIVGMVDTPGYAYGVTVMNQTAYVADGWSGLQVVDVSDPTEPSIVGMVDTPGYANDVAVLGQTAYVADEWRGLQIIDVSKPQNQAILGSVDTPSYALDIAVLDRTAYVAADSGGLQIIDVSDSLNPYIVGSVDTPNYALGVTVLDQTAYVAANSGGLQIIDVTDPINPAVVGSVDTPEQAHGVAVADQTAYVADGYGGLQIIDVSKPETPAIIGMVDTPGHALDVAVLGKTAYIADQHEGLQVVDIADPQNPTIIGFVETPGFATGITAVDQTVYVADDLAGLQIIDASDPLNPSIVGSVDTPSFALCVVVLGKTAYVGDMYGGLQIIDVSDPQNPAIIGSVDTPGNPANVAVLGQIAYVADNDAGLVIVPIPQEIVPIQVIGPEELQLTLPGPSIAGHYNLRVINQADSDEMIGAVSFLEPEDHENQLQKKAIVVAGSTGDPSDRLAIPVRNCANLAYLSLLSQGYARENIQFLAPHADWDVDGDGALNDVDDVCTTATLSAAIAEWGSVSSELIVFLAGHGGVGTFYANAGDIVQASDLDYWLDVAQLSIPGKAVLLYDACFSGSFLAQMLPPSGKERTVVASSLSDERAWFMNDGVLSFGYQFWASVFVNANLYASFVVGKNMMAHDQTSVLDANGDGEQTKEDVELVRDFVIGRGRVAASTPPAIGEVSGEQVLSGTLSANLWASDIAALNDLERVWAVIVPPDFDNAAGDEVTGLDTVELADLDQDGVYSGQYDKFVAPGVYDIFVYASDVFETFSLPVATTVVVADSGTEGTVYIDWSGDCGVGRQPCHDTVQQGLEETGSPDFLLKIAQGDYHENLTAENDCCYKLSGGYDSGYSNQNGLSSIIGSLTITKGTLEMDNLSIGGQ